MIHLILHGRLQPNAQCSAIKSFGEPMEATSTPTIHSIDLWRLQNDFQKQMDFTSSSHKQLPVYFWVASTSFGSFCKACWGPWRPMEWVAHPAQPRRSLRKLPEEFCREALSMWSQPTIDQVSTHSLGNAVPWCSVKWMLWMSHCRKGYNV